MNVVPPIVANVRKLKSLADEVFLKLDNMRTAKEGSLYDITQAAADKARIKSLLEELLLQVDEAEVSNLSKLSKESVNEEETEALNKEIASLSAERDQILYRSSAAVKGMLSQ